MMIKARFLRFAERIGLACFVRWFHKYHASVGVAATLVVVLASGLYAFFEYENKQDEARIKRALDYVSLIQSGSVSDAKRQFDIFYIGNKELVQTAQETQDTKVFEEIYSKLEAQYLAKANGIDNVVRLFYFYDNVAACVNLGLCDLETACFYFDKDIRSFKGLFKKFLDEWEVAWATTIRLQTKKFTDKCDDNK